MHTEFHFCPDTRFRVMNTSFCALCIFGVLIGAAYVRVAMVSGFCGCRTYHVGEFRIFWCYFWMTLSNAFWSRNILKETTCVFERKKDTKYPLFFSIRALFFSTQTAYSYLSGDFRWKIFLWLFLYHGTWHFRFIDFDGVEVILEPDCREWNLRWHITSCRNNISIKHTASQVFLLFLG